MKKLFLLLPFSFLLWSSAWSQKDTLFFLYKGTFYSEKGFTQNQHIVKTCNNKVVNFSIIGKNGVKHECTYLVEYNKCTTFDLSQVLMSKNVYFLDYLSELSAEDFIRKFGCINYQNNERLVFLIPVADINRCSCTGYQIHFYSDFLWPKE